MPSSLPTMLSVGTGARECDLVEDDMRRIRRHGREINPGASQTANRCEEVLNKARPIVFDEVKAAPDVKAVDDDRRRSKDRGAATPPGRDGSSRWWTRAVARHQPD